MSEVMTKRQLVALEMLKENITLIRSDDDTQVELILDALKFADLFLDLSEDEKV